MGAHEQVSHPSPGGVGCSVFAAPRRGPLARLLTAAAHGNGGQIGFDTCLESRRSHLRRQTYRVGPPRRRSRWDRTGPACSPRRQPPTPWKCRRGRLRRSLERPLSRPQRRHNCWPYVFAFGTVPSCGRLATGPPTCFVSAGSGRGCAKADAARRTASVRCRYDSKWVAPPLDVPLLDNAPRTRRSRPAAGLSLSSLRRTARPQALRRHRQAVPYASLHLAVPRIDRRRLDRPPSSVPAARRVGLSPRPRNFPSVPQGRSVRAGVDVWRALSPACAPGTDMCRDGRHFNPPGVDGEPVRPVMRHPWRTSERFAPVTGRTL